MPTYLVMVWDDEETWIDELGKHYGVWSIKYWATNKRMAERSFKEWCGKYRLVKMVRCEELMSQTEED